MKNKLKTLNTLINNPQIIGLLILTFTISLIISSCNKDDDSPIVPVSAFKQDIEKILTEKIEEFGVAGVTAFIQNAEGEFCNTGIGFADTDNKTPMQHDTKMRIASISKTFLATVVLQLWEEQLLDIDQLMSEYLPDSIVTMFPYGAEVNLKQLLNHTSGIYNFEDNQFIEILLGDPQHHWIPYKLLLHAVNADSSVHHIPGELYSYSNTNYILLGLIVESVTDISMEKNIRDRVLSPLNLKNTYSGNESIPQENYANGYVQISETEVLIANDQTLPLYFEWAHGQMVSTSEDLSIFFSSLLKGNLFKETATLNEMINFSPLSQYTYGLGICIFNEQIGLGHNGSTVGFISFAAYSPENNTTIVFCYNGMGMNLMSEIVQEILTLL